MADAPPIRILIADDAPDIVRVLTAHVKASGFEAVVANSGEEALEKFAGESPDLAIVDLNMPGMNGLQVLTEIRKQSPDFPVIILTGDTSLETAVEAMRKGAYDFLGKPVDSTVLEVTLRQAAERVRLRREVKLLAAQLGESTDAIVAESAGMKRAMRVLRQAVDSNATVLLLGESGTGKSVLARELHRMSARHDGPFIAVNCAAIPEHLLESELFGHEKGAFTGATARRIGKFEAARGGFIFLDEIGEMPLPMQAKLLRVLQEKEIVRVGANEPIPLDVRVVAATNADLEEKMERGDFREDLYYRLAVLEILVPPLRERRGDIEPLARSFLQRIAAEEDRAEVPELSPELLDGLEEFDFPGNIRQLENVLTRAVVVAEGPQLTIDDLPPSVRKRLGRLREASSRGEPGPKESGDEAQLKSPLMFACEDDVPRLADLEVAVMKQTLDVCGGNVTRAAKLLGIGRATLYRRLYAAKGNGDDSDDGSDSNDTDAD